MAVYEEPFDPELGPFLSSLRDALDAGRVRGPLDPRIPDRLMDETQELLAASSGRAEDAARMRRQRRELWNGWLGLLEETKTRIQRDRIEAGETPFSEICRWELVVRWHLLRLRSAGWAHFHGFRRGHAGQAASAVRGLLCSLR